MQPMRNGARRGVSDLRRDEVSNVLRRRHCAGWPVGTPAPSGDRSQRPYVPPDPDARAELPELFSYTRTASLPRRDHLPARMTTTCMTGTDQTVVALTGEGQALGQRRVHAGPAALAALSWVRCEVQGLRAAVRTSRKADSAERVAGLVLHEVLVGRDWRLREPERRVEVGGPVLDGDQGDQAHSGPELVTEVGGLSVLVVAVFH